MTESMLKPIQNVLMFMSILAPVSIYVYSFFTTEAGCTAVSLIEFIDSRTSMAQTPLGPRKLARVRGSSS